MGLGLWKRKYILRRFGNAVAGGGYVSESYTDMVVNVDIQTTDRSTTTSETGDRTVQNLKVFTRDEKFEIRPANKERGTTGDWIWFQGRWFECRSSRLSDNTILRHWTCTFTEVFNQEDPPDEGLLA